MSLRAVHDHPFHVFGEEVAHGAFDEVGLLEHAGGGPLALDLVLNFAPLLKQQGDVTDEIALLLALARSAHDHAHAFGKG